MGRLRYFAGMAAWTVAAAGLIVAVGWIAGIESLVRIVDRWASMKMNTAVGFVLGGLGLAAQSPAWPARLNGRMVTGVSVVLLLALAGTTLVEYAADLGSGIDQWLASDPWSDAEVAPPGRMSFATASGLMLVALSLAGLLPKWNGAIVWSQGLAGFALLAGGIGMLGYLFGVSGLYSFLPFSSMAVHTSVLFVLLGAGILAVRGDSGPVVILNSERVGGTMARRLLPVAGGLPIVLGWLVMRGADAGFYDQRLGMAILIQLIVVVLVVVVWLNARSLDGLHTALEERHREAALLAAIVDASDDAIIGSDLNGQVTSWNPGAVRLFGVESEAMIGADGERVTPEESRADEVQILEQVHAGQAVGPYESKRQRRDGVIFPVSITMSPIRGATGEVIGVSRILRDISRRKASEAKLVATLRELEDFKTALDEHAIVAITDSAGRIVYVNDRFVAISGYERDELLGQDHRLINSGYHAPEFFHDLWRTIRRGEVWRGEVKNRAKDGSYYWVETTVVPFVNDAGRPRQYVAIRSDITPIKVAEAELMRQATELKRSNADLEQFAYVASHDLREPLRAVAGCLQVLERRLGAELDGRAGELIEHAVEGAERMQSLIDGLLEYSRVGTRGAAFQSVDCNVVLAAVRRNLALAIEDAEAEIECDALPTLWGDPVQLTQLLQNLLANALKFRAAGPPRVRVVAKQDDDGWKVSITDNGIGIDSRYFERIFAVFQRLHTRREYPGTGLGLALCKKIMERHGGSIAVESVPGEFTTFHCNFPSVP